MNSKRCSYHLYHSGKSKDLEALYQELGTKTKQISVTLPKARSSPNKVRSRSPYQAFVYITSTNIPSVKASQMAKPTVKTQEVQYPLPAPAHTKCVDVQYWYRR